jgi:cell division ATPase FtsA
VDVAEMIFDLPVRIGYPNDVPNAQDPAAASQYAAALGLALFGFKHQTGRPNRPVISPFVPGWLGSRVRTWFAGRF